MDDTASVALDWLAMPSRTDRVALAAGAAGIGIVVLLAVAIALDLTAQFDAAIIGAVRDAALFDLLSPLRVITELGSTWAIVGVAFVALAVGYALGPWRHGVAAALTIALASLGNSALKTYVARARPELLEPVIVEHGFSFPSGHSALGMVGYGVLAVLVERSRLPRPVRLGVNAGLGLLIVLIGLSRIWLGVHYPTDVLAGWGGGAVVVLLYATLTRGVSREPAEGAADADPTAPRSDPPERG